MTKVVIRGGLAWRREGDSLVTLTPGEAADEIERQQAEINLLQAMIRVDHLKKGSGCKCIVCSSVEPSGNDRP